MANKTSGSAQGISLPKGGGALHGIGEKFSPDLHTGTGNFTVPLTVPPGRNGFQPDINLVYSTGNGNGAFGLGWNLSIPGVSRKTAKGIPRYDDANDVFILSGAEDLVPISHAGAVTRYRPRTEGLFARIEHHRDATNDHWQVWSKDGLVSVYGTPGSAGTDPGVIADPARRTKAFAWKLTRTQDPFGNLIEYEYERDTGLDGPHHWDQLNLKSIRYADYAENEGTRFLISVLFRYEDRPDPFSEYRQGFEIRTRKRCTRIETHTQFDEDLLVRSYNFTYLDQRQDVKNLQDILPLNGVSLLSQVIVNGYNEIDHLPPLEFGYTRFEPNRRDFFPITGADMPPASLASPDYELADVIGNGLPDVLEMNGTVRYWRNLGGGRFDLPREMRTAPAGLRLADPTVQLIDANGDGRMDLMVTAESLTGYYPLQFGGLWDRKSFQRYQAAPSFNLEDPEVRLVDLDGDGVTDAIRSGARIECFFNHPQKGWTGTRCIERRDIADFPNINFSDPRVKWADMTGDGMQDVLLVHDGNVEYWPNLGYGNWGRRIAMHNSPRFPYNCDPKRILVGDVDGDGLADIIYVDDTKITLWMNQSGNRWSDPIEITGTPPVSDLDSVRLADMLGSGISGVLWTTDAGGLSRQSMWFHDFTGGTKPYLLSQMNNHLGAVTRVGYAPSTRFYLEDEQRPETRWRTPLPFPVQVVARVEVIDHISKGKLTTEYRYHDGYWDGAEREFRGFGRVDQRDTELFEEFHAGGLHPHERFESVDKKIFSPPLETRTWFHQGPVGEEFGEWEEADVGGEFWAGDPPMFAHRERLNAFLKTLPRRRDRRDALRTLRGSVLRTELYALDGTEQQYRPYTVTESLFGLREEAVPGPDEQDRLRIFFPHPLAQRTTQWERGDDPMTSVTFTNEYDDYGQARSQISIAVPRGRDPRRAALAAAPYLATHVRTMFARRDDEQCYIVNRVARATTYEIINDGSPSIFDLQRHILRGPLDSVISRRIIGQTLSYYDGPAFQGLPLGELGQFGEVVRSEALVLTEGILGEAYKQDDGSADIPPYLIPNVSPAWTAEYRQEFRDQFPALAGYTFHDGGSDVEDVRGYFAVSDMRRYDFHDVVPANPRGLIRETQDALGRGTTVQYVFALLPQAVTDPVGLTTTADYDLRVMQPSEVTDANGNQSRFFFTPLGLLRGTAIMGRVGESEGDTEESPGSQLFYDFLAFIEREEPVSVRTVKRVHHAHEADVPESQRDETITTVEYSDGFGRLLQTRAQAEDVIVGHPAFGGAVLPGDQIVDTGDAVGVEDPARVVVSGWQIYDNKGRVVEKYEPFFSSGFAYRAPLESEFGRKAAMQYDPRGQVIRTINPDRSEQRVIYGIPVGLANPERVTSTPWEAYTYDANDNAGRTHPDESLAYGQHWNTPASIEIDALGRTVKGVARNGPNPTTDWFATRSTYDIQGNLLTVTDPLGRVAFRHVYDLAKHTLRVESIDAGVKRAVFDVLGNAVEGQDSKGALVLQAYDILNRPIRLWARDDGESAVTLRQRLEYGDGGDPAQRADEREANRSANRLGKLFRHYDEAGRVTVEAYDFKGNVIEKSRQVISDEAILSVFDPPPPDWQVPAYRIDWEPAEGETVTEHADLLLNATDYRTSSTYDALNRIKTVRYPRDVDGQRKELRPIYNRAGALQQVGLDGTAYVQHIAYNAKGQRSLIAYGNGVMTRHAYDPETFRLARLRTERFTQSAPVTFHPSGAPLQDFAYEYDLAGNIVAIADRTPGCGVVNSSAGRDALDRTFTYDPLYRLLSATGRECLDIPHPRPFGDDPRCGFNSGNHGTPTQENAPDLTTLYREQYEYDAAGNMIVLRHQTDDGTWTRHFGMGGLTPHQWDQEWRSRLNAPGEWPSALGNQLTHVGDDEPDIPQTHVFDANGNLIREHTERHFEWDSADHMRVFGVQAGESEPSVHAHYLYDAAGQRVKKLVRKQGGHVEVTVYVDGIFEHHRLIHGDDLRQNNTLHVMDNQSRIALVRVGNPFSGDVTPPVKLHLGDHLGSSHVVIDGGGNWVNREEYTPYGESSFGSFAFKRYRFTGKERDEESGLNYHGARYYSPWLARWPSCDPVGIHGGLNLYAYAAANPLKFSDPLGTQPTPTDLGLDGIGEEGGFHTVARNIAINPVVPPVSTSQRKDKPPDFGQPFSNKTVAEIVNYYLLKAYESKSENWTDQMNWALQYVIYDRNNPPGRGRDLNYAAADHYLNNRMTISDGGRWVAPPLMAATYVYDAVKITLSPLGINANVFDQNADTPSFPDWRVRAWAIQGLDDGLLDYDRAEQLGEGLHLPSVSTTIPLLTDEKPLIRPNMLEEHTIMSGARMLGLEQELTDYGKAETDRWNAAHPDMQMVLDYPTSPH